MKIVYVYSSFWIASGADRVIVEKMNYLANVYHYDVTVITDSQCGKEFFFPLSKKVKHKDLNINFYQQYKYNYIKRFFVYKKLMKIYHDKLESALIKISPDVTVCTCGRELDFITRIKDGSKKVGEAHVSKENLRNFKELEQKGLAQKIIVWWERRKQYKAIRELDAFVVLTDDDAKAWKPIKKAFVIPNSVPFIIETPSTCQNKSIISVGRLYYQKGYERLIEAWSLISNKHLDWRIDLYGSGEMRDNLISLTKDLHVENSFFIHDPVKDIASRYVDASFYVMSSRFEGLPMVLIEAMTCGIPCISFDCPNGPSAIIEDGKNGFLVANGDVESLSRKIEWMIIHQDERKKMGKNARESVSCYKKDMVMNYWKTLFEEIV